MSARKSIPVLMAGLLVLVGTAIFFVAAQMVARDDGQRSRQMLATTSFEIASTLELALQHEQDLAVSAGAFAIGNPDATQAQFTRWSNSVQAFNRYPELLGIAVLELVPAQQLSGFLVRAAANGQAAPDASGGIDVTPPGVRPFYCLTAVSLSRARVAPSNTMLDYCSTALGPSLLKARDSGTGEYLPYRAGNQIEFVVGTPIYGGDGQPRTIPARRAALLGWTGTQILPSVLLATALRGHPDTAIAFRYGGGRSTVTFSAGSAPHDAQAMVVDLHTGWSVQTLGSVTGEGTFDNGNSLLVLLGGMSVSLLLGMLIYVLSTSRRRAMDLVKERTGQLRHQAFHDALTGLPNRALILDRANQMLFRSRRGGIAVAALFLDLDNFKDINDSLGHSNGDQLLIAVAARLAATLREGDTVGRLGGDEFVVLLEGQSLSAGVDAVADRVLNALEVPFEIPGCDLPLSITASIGIAEGDRPSPEELLRDADIALYQAKNAGKGCAVAFNPTMLEAVDDHRNLETDLHRAVEDQEFFLLYQPTVDLSTGVITGVEALLRWRHPERGIVSPANFIPALELSGLIVPVGRWILDEACQQAAEWARRGHRLSISVNVSGRQLDRDRIVEDVCSALNSSGLDPALLVLEVTETILMEDVEATVERLGLLKAIGIRLAIDDFGTGYSSIAYLQQFPIDILKIDRAFVSRIGDSEESAALVHTLVQLGRVLGLRTTAEGIETDDQWSKLIDEHVDTGQGYLFARPSTAAEVDRYLGRPARSLQLATQYP